MIDYERIFTPMFNQHARVVARANAPIEIPNWYKSKWFEGLDSRQVEEFTDDGLSPNKGGRIEAGNRELDAGSKTVYLSRLGAESLFFAWRRYYGDMMLG